MPGMGVHLRRNTQLKPRVLITPSAPSQAEAIVDGCWTSPWRTLRLLWARPSKTSGRRTTATTSCPRLRAAVISWRPVAPLAPRQTIRILSLPEPGSCRVHRVCSTMTTSCHNEHAMSNDARRQLDAPRSVKSSRRGTDAALMSFCPACRGRTRWTCCQHAVIVKR